MKQQDKTQSNALYKHGIKISTINLRGCKNTDPFFLKNEFTDSDIIFLQETWFYDTDFFYLDNVFDNHKNYSKSGFDNEAPLIGRPNGGVSICVKNNHTIIQEIKCNSKRIIGLSIKISDVELLVFSVYMPFDKHNAQSLAEFSVCLDELSTVLDQFPNTPFLIGGDFNCNLNLNEARPKLVHDFCTDHELDWNTISDQSVLKHSYLKVVGDTTHKSLVDWFLCSNNFDLQVTNSIITVSPNLNTDHRPIHSYLLLPNNFSCTVKNKNEFKPSTTRQEKLHTNILTSDEWSNFSFLSEVGLQEVLMPHDVISCSGCKNVEHTRKIQVHYDNIVYALKSAIIQTNPSVLVSPVSKKEKTPNLTNDNKRIRKEMKIPGWKTHVSPKQTIMIQLLQAWRMSGNKSVDSRLYRQYADARREYHKAIKLVKSQEKRMRLEATARSLKSAKSPSDFWKKLKKSFPTKRASPNEIDGLPIDNEEVSEKYSDIFQNEFNIYNPSSDRKKLINLIERSSSVQKKSDCWTQTNVHNAIKNLGMNKCSNDGMAPEIFTRCGPSLAIHLSLLFRAGETHNFLPEALSDGTIHPVPKANKDPSKSCNYRPITIGCVVAKIFEACVLIQYKSQLQTSSNQFGFKEGVGTGQCTLTIKSVVKHFIRNDSRVFAAFLDASHAFDRAKYYKIFSKLLLKGVPASVIRLLLAWYENTKIRINWRGRLSDKTFNIQHGVRQGGLLSPALFTAGLLDDLLIKLESSGIGCKIGFKYYGAIAYADDITLMASSLNGLNSLLKISESWGNENNIEFNPTKSQVICFSNKSKYWPKNFPINAYLNGNLIKTCDEVVHLGHVLTKNLDDSAELIKIARSFNKQFHAFFNRFHGITDTNLLIELYNSFCSSFYGLETIFKSDVSSAAFRFFKKSVNIALMKMLRLPRESISQFLIAEGIMNADTMWNYRAALFWRTTVSKNTPLNIFLTDINKGTAVTMLKEIGVLPPAIHLLSKQKLHQLIIYRWEVTKQLI